MVIPDVTWMIISIVLVIVSQSFIHSFKKKKKTIRYLSTLVLC